MRAKEGKLKSITLKLIIGDGHADEREVAWSQEVRQKSRLWEDQASASVR